MILYGKYFYRTSTLMCPNMNFGIIEVVKKEFDVSRIKEGIIIIKMDPMSRTF